MKKSVTVDELKVGDRLQGDLRSADGNVLISKGTPLTSNHLYRLMQWFGSSNRTFIIESDEPEPEKETNLDELQENTIMHLKNIYHATPDDLSSSLSDLEPFLSHIYDDLRTIEDLPSDAIKIKYADSSSNHYFRVARMSIALASIYNKSVPVGKRISLDSICLASLLYDYGRRFASDSEGLAQLKINKNTLKGVNVDRNLLDGTYQDSLSSLYSYIAFKDKVPEDVRSTILYCNQGNSAVKPLINTPSPILKSANIISICNTYDALLEHVVSNDVPAPFENVLSYMNQLSLDNSLDSDLYNLFLRHIPIYTPGTKVQLSSGESAVVIDTSRDFPAKPTVLILTPPNKTKVVDLSQTLTLTIRRIVQEHGNAVDSIQQEQLKGAQIPVSSKQNVADNDTPDSIVLQKNTANEQKPLAKKIRDSFESR